jgi:hypothetical protein
MRAATKSVVILSRPKGGEGSQPVPTAKQMIETRYEACPAEVDFAPRFKPSSAMTICKSFQTSAFAGGFRSRYAG